MALDVIVVGAGLAGLTVARGLAARGLDVAVLEARRRVGGRLLSVALDSGVVVDLGGQWLTAGHRRVRRLADVLGVPRVPVAGDGAGVFRSRTEGGVRFDAAAFRGLAQATGELERMAREVPLEAPWTAPMAERWDAATLEEWLDSEVPNEGARLCLRLLSEGHHCAAPSEISLLHALFYVGSNPGAYGEQAPVRPPESLVGGAQLLCVRIAHALGSRVRLGAAVRWVHHGPEGVRVGGDGFELAAARVVIAMPPALTAGIDFRPALPAPRRALASAASMGGGLKVQVLYPEPFWRRAGLSGYGLLDEGMLVTGSQPPDGGWGLLAALLGPAYSRRLAGLGADERRRALLEDLALLFGPRAREPAEYVERSWTESEFSGGDVGVLAPGALAAGGAALRAPVGRIHWAGTETAAAFYTHMEGAVDSAERAIEEVVEACT